MSAVLEDLVVKLSADTSGINSQLDQVTNKLGETDKASDGLTSTIKSLGATFLTAFAAREIVKSITDIAEGLTEISHQAQIAGTSVEDFSRLSFAAHQVDVSTEQLTTSIRFMQRALETAGSNTNLTDAFNKLGVNVKNIIDLKPEQQLAKLADGFQNISNPAERARLAMEIFGRSGALLLPLLLEGSDGLKKFADEADAWGATISTQATEEAKKFEEELNKLSDSYKGLKAQLAETGIYSVFVGWLDDIASALRDVIKYFNDASVEANSFNKTLEALGGSDSPDAIKYKASTKDQDAELDELNKLNKSISTVKDQLADPNTDKSFVPILQNNLDQYLKRQKEVQGFLNQDTGNIMSLNQKARGNSPQNQDLSPSELSSAEDYWNANHQNKPGGNVSDDQMKKAAEDQQKIQSEINRLLDQSYTTQQKISVEMQKANDLRDKGLVSQGDYEKIMTGLQKKMDEANRSLDTMENKTKDIANTFLDDVGNDIAKAFENGKISGKDLWKSFETDAIKAIISIWEAALQHDIMDALGISGTSKSTKGLGDLLVNGVSSLFGGSSDGFGQGIVRGGASDLLSAIPHFASGGPIGAGQAGIVGDAGEPELFVPQTSGNIIPFSQLGNSGKSNQVNYTTVIQATNAADIDRRLMATLPIMEQRITNKVLTNMNNGGAMSRAINRRV